VNVNDTLLVTINLSDNIEDSTVEVITYLDQYREIINIFRGPDAEVVYKTLINEHLFANSIKRLEELKDNDDSFSRCSVDSLKWTHEGQALGKISTKEVDGEAVYILEKTEDNNDDRNLDISED